MRLIECYHDASQSRAESGSSVVSHILALAPQLPPGMNWLELSNR